MMFSLFGSRQIKMDDFKYNNNDFASKLERNMIQIEGFR